MCRVNRQFQGVGTPSACRLSVRGHSWHPQVTRRCRPAGLWPAAPAAAAAAAPAAGHHRCLVAAAAARRRCPRHRAERRRALLAAAAAGACPELLPRRGELPGRLGPTRQGRASVPCAVPAAATPTGPAVGWARRLRRCGQAQAAAAQPDKPVRAVGGVGHQQWLQGSSNGRPS